MGGRGSGEDSREAGRRGREDSRRRGASRRPPRERGRACGPAAALIRSSRRWRRWRRRGCRPRPAPRGSRTARAGWARQARPAAPPPPPALPPRAHTAVVVRGWRRAGSGRHCPQERWGRPAAGGRAGSRHALCAAQTQARQPPTCSSEGALLRYQAFMASAPCGGTAAWRGGVGSRRGRVRRPAWPGAGPPPPPRPPPPCLCARTARLCKLCPGAPRTSGRSRRNQGWQKTPAVLRRCRWGSGGQAGGGRVGAWSGMRASPRRCQPTTAAGAPAWPGSPAGSPTAGRQHRRRLGVRARLQRVGGQQARQHVAALGGERHGLGRHGPQPARHAPRKVAVRGVEGVPPKQQGVQDDAAGPAGVCWVAREDQRCRQPSCSGPGQSPAAGSPAGTPLCPQPRPPARARAGALTTCLRALRRTWRCRQSPREPCRVACPRLRVCGGRRVGSSAQAAAEQQPAVAAAAAGSWSQRPPNTAA